ncbi:MAG: hypothetical protein Q9224_001318 [Gallowayella concinna]
MLSEPAKQRSGRALLDSLLVRSPPLVDFNAVATIQTFAELRNEIDPRIDTMWMQAANAQPNDEELHKHWFKSRFRMRDWQGARKAAMTYTKHFPNRREPFFWTIFANFMASRSLTDQDNERNLCRTMAYRMCAKAAEAVPLNTNQKGLKNGRVLRTVDDIVFLLDVYESGGKYEEAIAVLDSDVTGIKSTIGKQSWRLVTLKIRLLGLANRLLDQYKYCFELLEDARPAKDQPQVHGFGALGNDGYVWTALINAALKLPFHDCIVDPDAIAAKGLETAVCEAKEEKTRLMDIIFSLSFYHYTRVAVGALLDEYNTDRNAMCAGMTLLSRLHTGAEETLADKAFQYFTTYGHKTFCFDDLQPYICAMELPVVQRFLLKVTIWLKERGDRIEGQGHDKSFDANMLMAIITGRKLEYCIFHSRDRKSDQLEHDTDLTTFIVECLKCYDLGLEHSGNNDEKPKKFAERFPGDDAGLLAAAALLKFARESRNDTMLQTIILLEELSTRSSACYEAFGTLVLLYIRVGAGLLAGRSYHRLSIKNIQIPTLSWLLCTRVSTTHPHTLHFKNSSFRNDLQISEVEADPVQHLKQALDYHLHIQETDQQEILEFLEAEQYASLHRAMANSLVNQNGFTKYMLLIEWARTQRMSRLQQKRDYGPLSDQPAATFANRDATPIPRWEHSDSRSLLLDIMPGGWPTDAWLSSQIAISDTFDHATIRNESTKRPGMHRDTTAHSQRGQGSTWEEKAQYHTAVECQSILDIYELKRSEEDARKRASRSIQESLDIIEQQQISLNEEIATMRYRVYDYFWMITDEVIAPSWLFFHSAYTGLDTIILIEKTLDAMESENRKFRILDSRLAAEQFTRIRKHCNELRTIVHAAAEVLYHEFSSDRHHKEMLYTVVGRPGDTKEDDPIAYALRSHLDKRIGGADEVAQGYITRLCQAWCEALQNLLVLTSKP